MRFVPCVRNIDYPASLELRKVYRLLPDDLATKHRQVRVVDESGEDYLYPEEYFVPITASCRESSAGKQLRLKWFISETRPVAISLP